MHTISFQLALLSLIISSCLALIELENTTDTTPSAVIPTLTNSGPTTKQLRLCHKNDTISQRYCKCNDNVVSCDFSNFSKETENTDTTGSQNNTIVQDIELELYGFSYPPNATRMCLCNTPSHLHLDLSLGNFLPIRNNFQRFDLYNLSGTTHLNGGFKQNFNGDLIFSKVANIPEISAFEFGRGRDEVDYLVHQTYPCCSPVNFNKNYKKPVLLIDETNIMSISSKGINDLHLWSTVIMNGTIVSNISSQGIVFDSEHSVDIAFIDCGFAHVKFQGLELGAKNLLLARNYFEWTVSSAALQGVSNSNDSMIVLFVNTFWNSALMDFDANNIVVQHNLFNIWDNYTFSQMKSTRWFNQGRNISLQYNAVEYEELSDKSIDFNSTNLQLHDNIIGTCNCSKSKIQDEVLDPKHNWCYTGKSVSSFMSDSHKCSMRLSYAFEQCHDWETKGKPNFDELCNKADGINAVHGLVTIREDMERFPDVETKFFKWVLQDFGSILKHKHNSQEEEDIPAHHENETTHNGKKDKSSSSTAVTVTVVMIVLLSVVATFFLYRRRKLCFKTYGGYRREEFGESREQML